MSYSTDTHTGSNISRIHALSSAIAAHILTSGMASKGQARKALLPIRAALSGSSVMWADGETLTAILTAAGEGWEGFAEPDEMVNKKTGVRYASFSGLTAPDTFTGKGEGSLSHLFSTLIPADFEADEAWAALPDRAVTKVSGPKGGSGVPAVYDFATAGISDALIRVIAYTAQNDVSFEVKHGVAHVKTGTKYFATVDAHGQQSAPIIHPETRQELKGNEQKKAQALEAKLIWTARNYGKLKKVTQGKAARDLASYLLDVYVQAGNAGDAIGQVRPVWQAVTPAHRAAALAALAKEGAPDEKYVVGLGSIKVLSN